MGLHPLFGAWLGNCWLASPPKVFYQICFALYSTWSNASCWVLQYDIPALILVRSLRLDGLAVDDDAPGSFNAVKARPRVATEDSGTGVKAAPTYIFNEIDFIHESINAEKNGIITERLRGEICQPKLGHWLVVAQCD